MIPNNINNSRQSPRSTTTWIPSSTASPPSTSNPPIPSLQQQHILRHNNQPPHHPLFLNRSPPQQQLPIQRYQQPSNTEHPPSDRYLSILLPHIQNDDRHNQNIRSQSTHAIPTIHPHTQQHAQNHQQDLFSHRSHFLSQSQQQLIHNRQRLSQQQHHRFHSSPSTSSQQQHIPDELPQLRSMLPLPSAKALQQHSSSNPFHSQPASAPPAPILTTIRPSTSDTRPRAPHPSTKTSSYIRSSPHMHPAPATHSTFHPDAIRAFAEADPTSPDRADFVSAYLDLMRAYEEKFDSIYATAESSCVQMTLNSRVPYLEDTITAPVDDETSEDARQKLIVKRKFVEAMEKLQGDQLPTKRRGNLPKESTAYLKRWFDEHYDHPYPSDEEKLAMSKAARIGITQISHWFINHRKRVWKPSLPASHPVHNGDSSNKKRKKSKKDLPMPR